VKALRAASKWANTAVALSALGVQTALISCVGRDTWGEQAIAQLGICGVDTSFVKQSASEGTSINVITVTPDGERTMFAYRGASVELDAEAVPDLAGARHLHISGYALLAEPQRSAVFCATERAKCAGFTISMNIPVGPANTVPDILRDFIPQLDLVMLGAQQAKALTGVAETSVAVEEIAKLGVSSVAVTLAEAGSMLWEKGQLTSVAALRLNTVDTTGAGDSFSAGLIFSRLLGVADVETQCFFANSCGGAAVEVQGAGAALAQPMREVREKLGIRGNQFAKNFLPTHTG